MILLIPNLNAYLKKSFILLVCLVLVSISFATTKTSTGSGNWSTAATWSPSGVPANGDAVVIQSGHTVIVDVNSNNLLSLTISGTLTIGNNNTNRIVTVTGSVIVNSGAVLNTAGNGGNNLIIGGNLTNNGTFDMVIGSATSSITFNGTTNQTLSGTGATTDIQAITISNTGATGNNIVEIMPTNFTAAAGFLTFTSGIIKMSGSYTLTNTFFSSANTTISSSEGIWLNNPNITITAQNGSITTTGLVRVTSGTFNIGTTANKSLVYDNGAIVTIEGGAMTISGSLRGNTTASTVTYTQSGGTLTLNTVNNTAAQGSFDISSTGSVFNWSNGTIILQKAASSATDYVNNSTSATVTGGTLQIGNASTAASADFWISSPCAIYNLVVNSTNTPTTDLRVNTTVLNDVTNAGILTVTSLTPNPSIAVGHNWTNNGTFTQGTGTVTFNGISAQQIGGSNATTFYNLTINKSAGGVTLSHAITVQGAGVFTAGIVTSTATNILNFADGATTSGANNSGTPSFVDGPVQKTGNDPFVFPVGVTGTGYVPIGISAPSTTTSAFTAQYSRPNTAATTSPITAAGLNHVTGCDFWTLNRTSGTSSVNVTGYWNTQSPCGGQTLSQYIDNVASIALVHYNGTSWNAFGSNTITGDNITGGSVTWNGVSTFSPFALGSTSLFNPLPVTLINFSAVENNNTVSLIWQTKQEDNTDHFSVQRSTNGNDYVNIGEVRAAGNSASTLNYSFEDENPVQGSNYYRIVMVDKDNTMRYSDVRILNFDGTNKILVYPNPSKDNITIAGVETGMQMRLISADGRILATRLVKSTTERISIQSLATGVYYLQVSKNGMPVNTAKLVKE